MLEVFDPTLATGKDLVGRFDFVIDYGYYGDGDGELWLDPDTVSYAVRKNGSYPSRCSYRLVADTLPGEPAVPGWSDTTFRSTDRVYPAHGRGRHRRWQSRRHARLLQEDLLMLTVDEAFRKFRSRLEPTRHRRGRRQPAAASHP